jgi:hypothetical protein
VAVRIRRLQERKRGIEKTGVFEEKRRDGVCGLGGWKGARIPQEQ